MRSVVNSLNAVHKYASECDDGPQTQKKLGATQLSNLCIPIILIDINRQILLLTFAGCVCNSGRWQHHIDVFFYGRTNLHELARKVMT